MAKIKVKMLATAASPDMVLQAGQVYALPEELANRLLAGGRIGHAGPTLPAAELAPPGAKATPITPRPDPGELEQSNFNDEV